jgi:histidyl-tRNA synthetase
MEPKPLKLFYFGNCYRYDRPQKGRYREFMQAGCELIGTDSCEAIAELISMSYYILKNVGLKDIILKIGNLNLIEAIFDKLEISKDDRKDLLPLIDKSEFEETCKYLEKIGISKEKIDIFIEIIKKSDIDIISNFLKDDEESIKEISKMEKLFDLIFNCFSIKECEMDISIVRGLDYYNGIVFEINSPKLGAEKQLCGGGIYELVKLFGGREIPTSGFAIGFDRTILALEIEDYKFIEKQIDVFVVPIQDETLKKSIEIVQMLRNNSFSAEFDLQKRGVGKALKYANSKNAKKVIIIGPDELKNNSVTIRDMKSGDQELVKISDILSKLK